MLFNTEKGMRYFHTYIRRNTESITISASLLPLSMPLHPTPFPLTFPLLHRKEIHGSQFYAFPWWHRLSSLLEEPTVWGFQSHLTSETGANFFVHLALNIFNLESNIPFKQFVSFWHTVQLLKKAVGFYLNKQKQVNSRCTLRLWLRLKKKNPE